MTMSQFEAPTGMTMEEEEKQGGNNGNDPKPYEWLDDAAPSAEIQNLWNEVGNGLDKSQTVVWKNAVESLETAYSNFRSSPDARAFVEKYMTQIVGILVDQVPSKIGNYERECVQDSLNLAVQIVALDLEIQLERRGVCQVMRTLDHIFSKNRNYYGKNKINNPGAWQHHRGGMAGGLPDVRHAMIVKFHLVGGFKWLAQYMRQTIGTDHFLEVDPLRHILIATSDLVSRQLNKTNNKNNAQGVKIGDALQREVEDDAIDVGEAVMAFVSHMMDNDMKKIPVEQLSGLQKNLQQLFDHLVVTRRDATYAFYAFWRQLVWKLITSSSLPLKLHGWESVGELIAACERQRPPPRTFWVQGAGCSFANGLYHYSGPLTADGGYHRPGEEIMYTRQVPRSDPQQGGHKLTLFRCTMRSQQKWWFLSEADEEQPGTDRDIDYYQHKSLKDQEEPYPPATGWSTCRASGVDPPPTMQAIGWMVPPGEEHNTLEHQLAIWAIEQKIVEQVLGDTTSHREVVARSTALIKFLAQMCCRDDSVLATAPPQVIQESLSEEQQYQQLDTQVGSSDDSSIKNNKEQRQACETGTGTSKPEKMHTESVDGTLDSCKYCLQASHLLYAWKTCTRKADAAVSAQVYQLLVTILPLCPPSLAIPLLRAVQKSLNDPEHNSEVGEFCGALAEGGLIEPSNKAGAGSSSLDDSVRLEIMNLMWAVLTHPGASSLKTYESIKRYVNFELRGEKGEEHRERFLRFCFDALENSVTGKNVDEAHALLMVSLTLFVLEACPRPQADLWASRNNGAFPQLLFNELKAYLLRRKDLASRGFRKAITASSSSISNSAGLAKANTVATVITQEMLQQQHRVAFQDRLRVLRHVYGLSDPRAGADDHIVMSAEMIKALWALCSDPTDQELMIIFIAGASHTGKITGETPVQHPTNVLAQQPDPTILSPAFTEEVCRHIFVDLFCVDDFDFSILGYGGYKSFHSLFLMLRRSAHGDPAEKKLALDVLWRVCLRASSNDVAEQAMRDLLTVYIFRPQPASASTSQMSPSLLPTDGDFGSRIFQCLSKVKEDLQNNSYGALRAAERCIRILNASVGQQIENTGSYSSTPSTLARMSALPASASLDDVQKCLPHGLRGQAACFRVAVTARRNPMHSSTSQNLLANAANGPGQDAPAPVRLPNTSRFTLDLHPLESLFSVKRRIAAICECPVTSVKPLHITGRRVVGNSVEPGNANISLSAVADDSVMDELGIVQGCEIVVSITDRIQSSMALISLNRSVADSSDLSEYFFNDDNNFADQLFSVLMELLDQFLDSPKDEATMDVDWSSNSLTRTRHLVWELLEAMPTNSSILSRVLSATGKPASPVPGVDPMEIDPAGDNSWNQIIDTGSLNRAVYVLLTIDAMLNPAVEALSILPAGQRTVLEQQLSDDTVAFRQHFVESGGFAAVVNFFSRGDTRESALDSRRGNAVALRILKSCLFAVESDTVISEAGNNLARSLSNTEGLMKSLTSMVVDDAGVPSSTVMDVLRFLRLLFGTPNGAEIFMNLPRDLAKRLVISLLVKDEDADYGRFSSSIKSSMQVRNAISEMILQTPLLADCCLPWLVEAVEKAEVKSETTFELFNTLEKLVSDHGGTARSQPASEAELGHLALIVCRTLSSCPRPESESELADLTTGVLCGCLRLLRALVEKGNGLMLRPGTDLLLGSLPVPRWSEGSGAVSRDDVTLLDLMGVIFDGFLTPLENSSVSICCDRDSRREGFDVVASAAGKCNAGKGYLAIVGRINTLVQTCAPSLRHRWGEFGGSHESHARGTKASKYSGLRNQGCTCYMNSALQQLFMMPKLRDSLCSASLPTSLRVSGVATSKGAELIGKKVAVQWETGTSYDAIVEGFNEETGMHTIRYTPVQVATVSSAHQQVGPEDVEKLPPMLPDEFILSEGRPGKETGVFEVVHDPANFQEGNIEQKSDAEPMQVGDIRESEDEAASRHLLEEVQRTFIHLAEGSKGRCFDPRALVEACACLKLEFDVWQQNDASEFVTKLLDRLESSLKKWAPESFKYLDHTFGLKQTSQKICKECGLKTNKEEKLINIDCQIRGKSDIHEALAAMTEADVMEGSNKVSCDRCKKKTDTILRTAISTLPNVLVLSLKRFDLDFATFETVKLNSRCAFGHTLNMKHYTIEGIEALEAAAEKRDNSDDPSPMDTDNNDADPFAALPDEDYEYKLAGVLVHAGVAQGGHYYSFIRDRHTDGGEEKWYRFDDEDVTVFNPLSIEVECFGGKIKKETKWPSGQVHTVEQEQFANALMLFYEKVKPTPTPEEEEKTDGKVTISGVATSNGYETFKADVQQTNATHKLQSFLFDFECQSFLKGLGGICNLYELEDSLMSSDDWRGPLLQSVLSYVFDVFLYAAEKPALSEWALSLERILHRDKEGSLEFVRKLAKKTVEVSGNWLRSYLLECPDKSAREISVRIFTAAMVSCAWAETEMSMLQSWGNAFEDMADEVLQFMVDTKEPRALSPRVGDDCIDLEDITKVDSGETSSLGIIFSFVNVLLDCVPRCWRFSIEPCSFVRALSDVKINDIYVFRTPLVQCEMPARLVALALRDRSSAYIRHALAGVSCPPDVAVTQARAESSQTHHVMPIGSNQAVGSDMKSSRGPGHFDYLVILEALASIIGLPGALHVPLYYESDEGGHVLDKVCLTDEAVGALTTVFNDNCTAGAPGMGQRDIEAYLRKTGVDASGITQQKIADLMTKYPTAHPSIGSPPRETSYLSLEGFLAYYKEVIQSSEGKVQQDLHIFGFRPDLSRRSHTARTRLINEHEHQISASESVAIDVSESLEAPAQMGKLGYYAFMSAAMPVFNLAFDISEPLAEYLIAGFVYKRDAEIVIHHLLSSLHRSPNDWGGNVSIPAIVRTLSVIASVSDPFQDARIGSMMLSNHRISHADFGSGLLVALKAYHRGRQTQHYNNEYHWGFERVLNVLKELRRLTWSVYRWMGENQDKWEFLQRDLLDNRAPGQYQAHRQRGDYGHRDADGHVVYNDNLPLDHHSHTDSDMAGPHESEDDDEDSQCDNLDGYKRHQPNSGPFQIVIEGAGARDVDGTYNQDGFFEGACKYSRHGRWKNALYKFHIFQCNVSNNTRHWYISIVPSGSNPGTSADIDFYTAPVSAECNQIPPQKNWTKTGDGADPPPVLKFVGRSHSEEDGQSWVLSGEDNTQEESQIRYV